jgi:hypothetical protein
VEVVVVAPIVVDAVEDEVRIILAHAEKIGMFTNLGKNVFDYGQKYAADQMCTSWEKLVQYVCTNYGQDINNGL